MNFRKIVCNDNLKFTDFLVYLFSVAYLEVGRTTLEESKAAIKVVKKVILNDIDIIKKQL